jgi:hypothetical protein
MATKIRNFKAVAASDLTMYPVQITNKIISRELERNALARLGFSGGGMLAEGQDKEKVQGTF